MPVRSKGMRRLLGWFLASVLVVLLITYLFAVFAHVSGPALAQAVVAACVSLGLLWIFVGWFLAPSVETYLGQGAFEGFPIIGPRFANPDRNRPVLDDLATKLSGQTDVGILFAALGFLLIVVGALYYEMPSVGPWVVVLYLGSVFVVLLFAFLPPPQPAVG